MAKLAIKSHATRGEEVVGILSMLGGVQCGYGCNSKGFYFLDDYDNIVVSSDIPKHRLIFTLEQFLKKFPYKVGDKVCFPDSPEHCLTIKRIWWNSDYSDLECTFYEDDIDVSVKDLEPYKKTMEYTINAEDIKSSKISITAQEAEIMCDQFVTPNKVEIVLGGNFEVKQEDGKWFIIKKQLQYPKTYEECCKVISISTRIEMVGYKWKLLQAFQKLLICRDAYWKIAGDWEPDWTDNNACYYAIATTKGDIGLMSSLYIDNGILVFPTKEMRDAFYENFKELINDCKELL